MTGSSIDTLIFDLGDVLFEWSASVATTMSPKVLRRVLNSVTWYEYEKGQFTEQDCYAAIAHELVLSVSDVTVGFQSLRQSLISRPYMFELIRELKHGRRVYAMSNMSAPD